MGTEVSWYLWRWASDGFSVLMFMEEGWGFFFGCGGWR